MTFTLKFFASYFYLSRQAIKTRLLDFKTHFLCFLIMKVLLLSFKVLYLCQPDLHATLPLARRVNACASKASPRAFLNLFYIHQNTLPLSLASLTFLSVLFRLFLLVTKLPKDLRFRS